MFFRRMLTGFHRVLTVINSTMATFQFHYYYGQLIDKNRNFPIYQDKERIIQVKHKYRCVKNRFTIIRKDDYSFFFEISTFSNSRYSCFAPYFAFSTKSRCHLVNALRSRSIYVVLREFSF